MPSPTRHGALRAGPLLVLALGACVHAEPGPGPDASGAAAGGAPGAPDSPAPAAGAGARDATGGASDDDAAAATSAEPPVPLPFEIAGAVTLGVGDLFVVRVYMESELSGEYRVGPEGTIIFPLVGEVRADGRTPNEIAQILRDRLGKSYLRDPQVTVFVREFTSKKVFVFGEVQHPGTLPFEPGMSVIQAITSAGGFTTAAARNRANVTRIVDGAERRVTVPVDSIVQGKARNYMLKPGDIIYVPESFF